MKFPGLLGNDKLQVRLRAQKRERGLSHAYLLAGPPAVESIRWRNC